MTDIATYAIRVGVKETVGQDMARLKPIIDSSMKAIENSMANPISEVDRKMAALIPTVERIGRAAAGNRFISERQLTDLDRAKTYVQGLAEQLMRLGPASTGFLKSLEGLQTLQQSISQIRQIAIPSLGSMGANAKEIASYRQQVLSDSLRNFIPFNQRQFGPVTPEGMGYNIRRVPADQRVVTRHVMNQEYGLPDGFGPLSFNRTNQRHILNRPLNELPEGFGPFSLRRSNQQHILNRQEYGLPEGFGPITPGMLNRGMPRFGPDSPGPHFDFNRRQQEGVDTRLGRNRFSAIADSEREAGRVRLSRDLNQQYDIEAQVYDKLTEKYSKWTDKQRDGERIRLRARADAGYDVSTRRRALEDVNDPFSTFNRGRQGGLLGSHGFRFASQNAAFALEDYMISSQFGGPKAGFRAITNNLTAIASTLPLNPLLSAGVIGATAIAGASAPLIYDRVMKDDVNREAQVKRVADYREFRESQDKSRLLDYYRLEDNPKDAIGMMKQKRRDLRQLKDQHTILTNEFESTRSTSQFTNNLDDQIKAATIWNQRNMNREEQNNLRKFISDAGVAFNNDMKLNEKQFESDKPFRSQLSSMLLRQNQGELIDPRERFKLDAERHNKAVDLEFKRPGITKQEMDLIDSKTKQLQFDRDEQFKLDDARYQQSLRERDFTHRERMSDFEINPRKRLTEQFNLDRDRILGDKGFTPEQQQLQIGGLQKQLQRNLSHLESAPTLGRGVDVGSVEDLMSRQKHFDSTGESGRPKQDSENLAELVREIRGLREDVKKTKPTTKAVR